MFVYIHCNSECIYICINEYVLLLFMFVTCLRVKRTNVTDVHVVSVRNMLYSNVIIMPVITRLLSNNTSI